MTKIYMIKRASLRQEAMDRLLAATFLDLSWGGLAAAGAYFAKMGGRYGLRAEFSEIGLY